MQRECSALWTKMSLLQFRLDGSCSVAATRLLDHGRTTGRSWDSRIIDGGVDDRENTGSSHAIDAFLRRAGQAVVPVLNEFGPTVLVSFNSNILHDLFRSLVRFILVNVTVYIGFHAETPPRPAGSRVASRVSPSGTMRLRYPGVTIALIFPQLFMRRSLNGFKACFTQV